MAINDPKGVVRGIVQAGWNSGDRGALDALLAADCHHHGLGGIDRYKAAILAFRAAFPDFHAAIDHLVGEGERVPLRLICHGAQQGPFTGIAPTGKQVTLTALAILRIVDGRMVGHLFLNDSHTVPLQLGAVPSSAQATG